MSNAQPPTDTDNLAKAIQVFEYLLPGWWWTVGACSVSRHASCGPDVAGPDAALLEQPKFDEGFHCDDPDGTCASALLNVLKQALAAKAVA